MGAKFGLYLLCCIAFAHMAFASSGGTDGTAIENVVQDDHKMEDGVHVEISEVSHDSIQDAIDAAYKHNLEVHSDRKYETRTHHGEISCMRFGRRMMSKIVSNFLVCTRELQLRRVDLRTKLKTNLPCLVKCISSKMGFFNENGTFDEEFYWKFLHEEVPKKFHKHANTIMNTCQGHVNLLDGGEPSCESYKPFFKCVVDNFMQLFSDALQLCTDVPDGIKTKATEVIQSNRTKEVISHYID